MLTLVVGTRIGGDGEVAPAAEEPRLLPCPLCHTPGPLSQSAIDAGGGWRCSRCRQPWDAARLNAVAAYAVWARERKAGQSLARRAWSVGAPPE